MDANDTRNSLYPRSWLRGVTAFRDDSPWYPTMRLFRQSKIGDWDEPIRRVVQSLHELVSQWS